MAQILFKMIVEQFQLALTAEAKERAQTLLPNPHRGFNRLNPFNAHSFDISEIQQNF